MAESKSDKLAAMSRVDAAEFHSATYLLRDSELKGFVLVVTPGGAKSYSIDYRTRSGRGSPKRRLTIGKHGSPWTPETARLEARRLLAEVAAGRDPAAARREERNALTFSELIDLYLAEGASHKKASTLSRRWPDRASSAAGARRPGSKSHRTRGD
jgi:hypothetical protein